jgi:PST family polysaccharide transporter
LSSPSPSNAEIPASETQTSTTYGQILKSSSILGGAQGLNYLIGMVRTKMVAILLGPTGIGLVGLYQSATSVVGTVTGMGIASSGVREVAKANGNDDTQQIALTVKVLRRACWVTGLFGWLLTALLSYPLSVWTFGSGDRATPLALLGITLLLTAINGGQNALLQGTRRISDLAKISILSMISSTAISVALYAWLREQGIVPVLLVSALVNIAFSWWFARKVEIPVIHLSWPETFAHSKGLVSLGVAFMWSALLATGSGLWIRGVIVRDCGLEANGIYQAAWGISGLFAGFILGAMGTDFFPRLTGVASDNRKVNQLVNEQIEIGLLLSFPGILGTLAFAPWLMKLFYSAKFIAGAELLPWFILGVFGRVISWPLGYMLMAKGASKWFAITETVFTILNVALAIYLLRIYGLTGIAMASAILYVIHNIGMVFLAAHLTGFRWSTGVIKLFAASCILITSGFAAGMFLPFGWAEGAGLILTLTATVFSLRGISSRLGTEHRMVQMACRFPGGRYLCGV